MLQYLTNNGQARAIALNHVAILLKGIAQLTVGRHQFLVRGANLDVELLILFKEFFVLKRFFNVLPKLLVIPGLG